MNTEHIPPFTITSSILSMVAEISERLGKLTLLDSFTKDVRLRRANRIRTIQGSLAIEGNTLTIEQITAILEGRRVIAPLREIQEVQNAIKVYDGFDTWKPHSLKDMLKAHRMLMAGLVKHPGLFRSGGVGVVRGKEVVHMAPPAARVPELMGNLFEWLKSTDTHPLVSSSVFHYEFEFIHPFTDGNGRMGRLWQSLILAKWTPLFANLPVESMVHKEQAGYYQALNKSTQNSDSAVFIEYMLKAILDTIRLLPAPEDAPEVTPEVKKMLGVIKGAMTRKEIQQKLGLKDEKHFREFYQQAATARGLIEMTIPSKPNSRLQKYRLTPKGSALNREDKP